MSISEKFPHVSDDLVAQSDLWAYERTAESLRDTIDSVSVGAFHKVFSIFQEHRKAVNSRIEAGGGVNRVETCEPTARGSTGINIVKLEDGSPILLSEMVQLPTFSTRLPVPDDVISGTSREHQLGFVFGGQLTGDKAENSDDVDCRIVSDGWYDLFTKDPSYFPEDSAIVERVITRIPAGEAGGAREHVEQNSYSLMGNIWRPHSIWDENETIPDYLTDPIGYRRWAIYSGDAKLQVSFTAPVVTKRKGPWDTVPTTRTEMKTVIKDGRIDTDQSDATVHDVVRIIRRYLDLLDFVYINVVPEAIRMDIDKEAVDLTSIAVPLERSTQQSAIGPTTTS